MAREATGTVVWVPPPAGNPQAKGHYKIRISLLDGTRPWIHCDPSAKSATAEQSARNKAAGYAQRARKDKCIGSDFDVKDRPLKPDAVGPLGETLTQWFGRWLKDRVAKGNKSTGDDLSRFRTHVQPVLGSIPITAITKIDVKQFVAGLDDRVRKNEISWKTASLAFGVLSMMLHDSAESKRVALCVRQDIPALGVEGPDRGISRAKAFLYPSELLKLASCAAIPKRWRRLFVTSIYFYTRAGELTALTWADVDLERKIVHIHASTDRNSGESNTTKTRSGVRRVPIESTLLPMLRAMKKEQGGEGRLFAWAATDRKLARQLQRCMTLAGLDREDLSADDDARKPLSFHDLRGTGVTWCAIRGDEPLRIKQRAGHATFSTTEGYIRTAEALGVENFGEVFPALPACLLNDDDGDSVDDLDDEPEPEPTEGSTTDADDESESPPSDVTEQQPTDTSQNPVESSAVVLGYVPPTHSEHLDKLSNASGICQSAPNLSDSFLLCKVGLIQFPAPPL